MRIGYARHSLFLGCGVISGPFRDQVGGIDESGELYGSKGLVEGADCAIDADLGAVVIYRFSESDSRSQQIAFQSN